MSAQPVDPWSRPRRSGLIAAPSALVLVLVPVLVAGCLGGGEQVSGDGKSFLLNGVENVEQVAQLTGPGSPNRTDRFEIAGQDLGSMFEAGGKTWFVFGDTFGQREPDLHGGGGTEWRSNTLAFTTDQDPTDGIRLDGYIVDDIGRAKELIDSKKVDGIEMTTIPTYGFEANGAMYLAYMSVRHWGEPGEWETNHSGFAKSTDQGQTWSNLGSPRWPGDSNFIQVATAKVDGDLYFWGVTHGRFGGVRLMKVAERDVERQGEYRYFSGLTSGGEPTWGADPSKATTIVDDTVGELSVVWNDYLSRWLMTYTNGAGEEATIREGITPWGPWGDAVTLVSSGAVPGLYSPYLLPRYVTNGGRTIYFSLSIWGPYNVFWYKADLVRKE